MKQTFVKTFHGHEVEFVRLLYPVRYNVFIRILNANPLRLTVEKGENGEWNAVQTDALPSHLSKIESDIKKAVIANESGKTVSNY